MKVINRRRGEVDVCFSHIRTRLEEAAARAPQGTKQFDVDAMALDVFAELRDGMSTADIDRTAVSVCTEGGHKGLADVLAASDLHRRLYYWMPQDDARDSAHSALDNRRPPPYSQRVSYLWKATTNVSDHFCKFVVEHAAALDSIPDYDLDLEFGHDEVDALLAKKCLWLFGGAVAETPQDMFLRVATAVHLDFKRPAEALKRIRKLYDLLSARKVELDPCTLRNAGGPLETLTSHVAMEIAPGGLPSIYKGLTDLAQILSTGSSATVNLNAVPVGSVAAVARLVGATAEYARTPPGKVDIVLSAWHGDIAGFLTLEAPALKRCVLVPNVLVKAAGEPEGPWFLFDARDAPELVVTWGRTFDAKYAQAVEAKRHLRVVKAAEVLKSCVDREDVRVVYVDRATDASPHRSVGGLRGGSCYCDAQAYNATIAASVRMDRIDGPAELRGVARTLVRALDRALEVSCHPTKEVYDAVQALRCIGVGLLGVDGAERASAAESLQFACLEASMRLVKDDGLPSFNCFQTSPYSGGQRRPRTRGGTESLRLDWSRLIADIRKHGLRNSTVTMAVDADTDAQSAVYFDQIIL